MKFVTLSLASLLVAGTAAAQQTTTGTSHNPAVATTSNANDSAVPAKGTNSFTEGQAQSRIADRGYTRVTDLKKDDDGVWRGVAQHNGQPVHVWLDYKGNVGEAR